MRDPFSWSFPLGSVFGIAIRIHFLMPVVMVALILRTMGKDFLPGTWIDAAMLMGLLFLSVLLHEFGHCFAARRMDGDASEVLMWPLGGLARVEVPHSPWPHFVVAAFGPLVNILLCIGAALALGLLLEPHYRPPLDPFWYPYRTSANGGMDLAVWGAAPDTNCTNIAAIVLTRFFYINWLLTLFNLVLIGFPMDGGRMLQSALWPRVGYRQATLYAIFFGFFCMVALFIASIAMERVLLLALGIFIYVACKQEWIMLETGAEDSVFGYDFSQGYTSLERDEAPPPRPRSRTSSSAGCAAAPRGNGSRSRSSSWPRSGAWTSCWRKSSGTARNRSPTRNSASSSAWRTAIGRNHHNPLRGKSETGFAGNPKSEYRNPKQIRISKSKAGRTTKRFWYLDFGFVSDFDIRISDFLGGVSDFPGRGPWIAAIPMRPRSRRTSRRTACAT